MVWQTIAAGEVDAESPLHSILFGKIRDNLNFLYSRGIVLSDPPTLLTSSWVTSWTDLTLNVPSGKASFAIIELRAKLGIESVSGDYARVEVRKKDDAAWTYFPSAEARDYKGGSTSSQASDRNMVFVPVDGTHKFQYRCATSASTVAVEIVQIGYMTKE